MLREMKGKFARPSVEVGDDTSCDLKDSTLLMKLLLMVLLFVGSLCLLCMMFKWHPEIPQDALVLFWKAVPNRLSFAELSKIRDLENVKTVFHVLSFYKESHQLYIVSILSLIYLICQSFPLFMLWLPGTGSAISLLIGSLFGFFKGLMICITLATIGPVLAYTLFAYTGKPILWRWFPTRLADMQIQLSAHANNMLGFLIFLRVSPFPNFLINIASPVLGVPLKTFVLATFLGLIPNTITLVSMGVTLTELTTLNGGVGVIWLVGIIGCTALLSGLLKKRLESHKSVQ